MPVADSTKKPGPQWPAVVAVVVALAASPPAVAGGTGTGQLPLHVAEEVRAGWSREAWGDWASGVRGCLDRRHEVLARTSRRPVTIEKCRVVSGAWVDAWTGEVTEDPRAVDIDHVVALQEAHDSGGWAWPPNRKLAFADDVDNLVPTLRATNRAKGAAGPETWLPPSLPAACAFGERWTAVKAKWGLSADRREAAALTQLFAACSRQQLSRQGAAARPHSPR